MNINNLPQGVSLQEINKDSLVKLLENRNELTSSTKNKINKLFGGSSEIGAVNVTVNKKSFFWKSEGEFEKSFQQRVCR